MASDDIAIAATRLRSFGDLSFGIGERSHEDLGVALGADLTFALGEALEYGGRFRFEWADHLSGTFCNDDGDGCTKATRDVAAVLLLARWRHSVAAGGPAIYIAGLGGFVHTVTSTDIVRPGPDAYEATSSDGDFGLGADVGLEFSQLNRWRGFVELGVMDIDGFDGFAPVLSIRSGVVRQWD